MAHIKVFYDRTGNTLTVWFDAPEKEYVSEETGEEIVLMKDRDGHVIGFEKLNFSQPNEEGELLRVAFETLTA
jgi:uncharacterized protein YuzE